jgi:hypothetical protein
MLRVKIKEPRIRPVFLPTRSQTQPATGRNRIAAKAKALCSAPMAAALPPKLVTNRGNTENRLWKLKKKKKFAAKATNKGQE